MTAVPTPSRGPRGLTRGRSVLLVALLGVTLVVTALPTWGRAQGQGTGGLVPITVPGTDAAPAVPSAGLVIIVAALVLGLSGRVTRIAALVGAGLAGILAGWSAIAYLLDPAPPLVTAAGDLTRVRELAGPATATPWPVATLIICACVVLIAVILPWRIGRWTAVGRRYQRGSAPLPEADAPARSARLRAMDDWDAIGRGEDPTTGPER